MVKKRVADLLVDTLVAAVLPLKQPVRCPTATC
jgi:hypothetical protein